MSADTLAMMPWFPRDYIADTRHWSVAERCLYRELLDFQWLLGVLPQAELELCRLAAFSKDEFDLAWPRVKEKFKPAENGGLQNLRLEEHRRKSLALRASRSNAGSKGGSKTQAKRQAGLEANGVAILKPPSPSPSPAFKTNTNGRTSFDLFWAAYPKKHKRKDAEKAWQQKQLDQKAEIILADVQRRPATERWKAGFIPDPPTYLRGERWNDAIDESPKVRIEGL